MTTANLAHQNSPPLTDLGQSASPRVAVIIPCYNEEVAIADVVAAFRQALPDAPIYVYDNASTDNTTAVAQRAGAIVRHEHRRGKGQVVRRMLADIDADIFVMVDGDDTYDAAAAPELIARLCDNHLDMVIGARREISHQAYRPGHRFGNWMLTTIVARSFGIAIKDMLSGYRVFTRRFAKSFPAASQGFEIETEFTVHAAEVGIAIEEVETRYKERPEGSTSKLRSFVDGFKISRLIARLIRDERPLEFFSLFGLTLAVLASAFSIPIIWEYFQTGLVPRQPTWVLAVALMVMAFLSVACGLILDGVARGRRAARRMAFLAIPQRWS